MAKKREEFLAYCQEYVYGTKRKVPLNERTVGRYLRGLQLVEKLIGHDLETVSYQDQLVFIEKIMGYPQGTRRVSTQIFQRFIAWGRHHKYFDCENILTARQNAIIGPNAKTTYTNYSKTEVRKFFRNLHTPSLRVLFGLIYYGGLTTTEVAYVTKDCITSSGVFVYRTVRRESQMLPLPESFLKEVQAYADEHEDPILGLDDSVASRFEISKRFRAAQVETGMLMGAKVRDFRTSGIRHFYDLSLDLDLTKAFAGVPQKKKGWLEGLLDVSDYHLKNIADVREYHAEKKRKTVRAE